MPANPLVSIIMNCYNGEEFLREAIESVYSQTYENWEIIFWDNCSTDSSAAIAQSYDNRVKYFLAEVNVPLGEARSLALAQAKGEFLCFLDTDDLWLPTKLQDQVEAMAAPEYALCYAGIEEIRESGEHLRNVLPLHSSGSIFPNLLIQYDVNILTPMIRASALKLSGLNFDPNIHGSEEYNLFIRFAAKHAFCTLPKILGQYRVREKSLTNQVINLWAHERFYTIDQVKRENPGIENKYPEAFRLAEARGAYYSARFHMACGHRAQARKALRPYLGCSLMYRGLYFVLFLPSFIWNTLHSDTIKRGSILKLFGFAR